MSDESACLLSELHVPRGVSAGANQSGMLILQISRGMLLIIMETESAAAADGDGDCIPLCVLDIKDGTVLKVCSL